MSVIDEYPKDWHFHPSLIALAAFLVLGFCVAIVPFEPFPPKATLDGSWEFALNEAISRRMVIGNDIILTFGPYASVYTKRYHPRTDRLMLGGSFLLVGAITSGLLILFRRQTLWLLVLAPFVFMLAPRDALCFSIPLLFSMAVAAAPLKKGIIKRRRDLILLYLSLGILTIAMALLPLIKLSFTVPVLLGLVLGTVIIACNRPLIALGTVLLFILSSIFLWLLAHQPLSALIAYFTAQLPIVSGYTEAMSLSGHSSDVFVYLSCTVLLLGLVLGSQVKKLRPFNLFLLVCAGGTLFVAFKAGFVRHDAHAVIASATMRPKAFYLR